MAKWYEECVSSFLECIFSFTKGKGYCKNQFVHALCSMSNVLQKLINLTKHATFWFAVPIVRLPSMSNFLPLTRLVTALRLFVCCIVCVCNRVMVIRMPHAKIHVTMQQTHMHKAVTGHVEAKSYSLVEGDWTIVVIKMGTIFHNKYILKWAGLTNVL